MTMLGRRLHRSTRWLFAVLAGVFLVAALAHVAADSGALAGQVDGSHGADVACSVVCDAATIATPSPEAISDATPAFAVAVMFLVLSIAASRTIARRAPSLVALSVSRT
ncbi:hypothetical protein [Mesorhizobium japonicum]|uniref:hypothetical protein n=1 Tax=Mesorhizobium japonicum TaxID=2066070 RepID=UPI003B58EE0A